MDLRDIAYRLDEPGPSYYDFTEEEKDAVESYRFDKKLQDIRSEIDPVKLIEDIEELVLWFDLIGTMDTRSYEIRSYYGGKHEDEARCPGCTAAHEEFDTYLIRRLHDPNKDIAQTALLALRDQRALSRILTPPWAFAPDLLPKVYVRLIDEMEMLPLYRFSAIEEVREYVWEHLKKAIRKEPCLYYNEGDRTELRAETLYEIASDLQDPNSDEAWDLLALLAYENARAMERKTVRQNRHGTVRSTTLAISCALETGRDVDLQRLEKYFEDELLFENMMDGNLDFIPTYRQICGFKSQRKIEIAAHSTRPEMRRAIRRAMTDDEIQEAEKRTSNLE